MTALLLAALLAAGSADPRPDQLLGRVVFYENDQVAGTVCPVSPTQAYTAAHIAAKMRESGQYGWSRGTSSGQVRVGKYDEGRDYALLTYASGDPFPQSSPVLDLPALLPGEVVYLVGDGITPMEKHVAVVTVGHYLGTGDDGDILADVAAYPGMSGGCLFDVHGNLRGIFKYVRAWEGGAHLRSLAGAWPVRKP